MTVQTSALPTPLDVEIGKVTRALLRHERAYGAYTRPYHPPHHCCPSCALGNDPTYKRLGAQIDRTEAWLEELLRKRNARRSIYR